MNQLSNNTEINTTIKDRTDSFYWQTDRKVEPKEAGKIWADRHQYFTDEQIIDSVNAIMEVINGEKIISLVPLDYKAQTSLGNVNSVRIGHLESGKEVIIRNHPTGIENGYFHVESLSAQKAKDLGIPSYSTYAIHDLINSKDHSFQVIEKLPGVSVKHYLAENPEKEDEILFEVGKTMAQLHKVEVDGFGPFDNEKAKKGILEGIHKTYESAVNAGLSFNCDVLKGEKLLNDEQIEKIKKLFHSNPLLENVKPVLIHNDFADWNLLTKDEKISGVTDLDEAVGGDPVSDIVCWSTFFPPERLDKMLKGYRSVTKKFDNFEEKFELFRLRYVISKMTLRLRRYSWNPSDSMKKMIKNGHEHLKQSLNYFGLE